MIIGMVLSMLASLGSFALGIYALVLNYTSLDTPKSQNIQAWLGMTLALLGIAKTMADFAEFASNPKVFNIPQPAQS